MLHQALLVTPKCLLSEPCDHTDSICEYLLLIIHLMGPLSTWQLAFDIFNNTLQIWKIVCSQTQLCHMRCI